MRTGVDRSKTAVVVDGRTSRADRILTSLKAAGYTVLAPTWIGQGALKRIAQLPPCEVYCVHAGEIDWAQELEKVLSCDEARVTTGATVVCVCFRAFDNGFSDVDGRSQFREVWQTIVERCDVITVPFGVRVGDEIDWGRTIEGREVVRAPKSSSECRAAMAMLCQGFLVTGLLAHRGMQWEMGIGRAVGWNEIPTGVRQNMEQGIENKWELVRSVRWWSQPFDDGSGFVGWDKVQSKLAGELKVEVGGLPRGVHDLVKTLKGSESQCLDSQTGPELVFRAYQELVGKLQ